MGKDINDFIDSLEALPIIEQPRLDISSVDFEDVIHNRIAINGLIKKLNKIQGELLNFPSKVKAEKS